MTDPPRSRDRAFFERIYAQSDDPWNFRASRYERDKYAATLAALPDRRFRRGLEVGCSIGELTALLAASCDALLGVDIASAPLAIAGARCAALPKVGFRQMAVPQDWPDGSFDLIVLSEVLYFFSPADVSVTADRVRQTLSADGIVLLVNWLGTGGDPGTGDSAAAQFIAAAAPALAVDEQQRQKDYRLDRLSRR